MISAWTKNCKTNEEKEAFQNKVLGSKEVFKRLQDILKEIEAEQDCI